MRRCLKCHQPRADQLFVHSGSQRNRVCWVCRRDYHSQRRQAIQDGTWAPTSNKPSYPQEATPKAIASPLLTGLAWAAGFLEAEGWFRKANSFNVGAGQYHEDAPLHQLQQMFGGGISGKEWVTYGPRALGIMLTLYPFLSTHRQNQVRAALKAPLLPAYQPPLAAVEALTEGEQRCQGCGQPRPLGEFALTPKGHRIHTCRSCKKEYQQQRAARLKAGTWVPGRRGPSATPDRTPRATHSPTTAELAWAAGFLEGEGHFRGGERMTQEINAPQNHSEPLYQLQAFLGGSVTFDPAAERWLWRVGGARARGVMLSLYLFLSPRRQHQVRRALGREPSRATP